VVKLLADHRGLRLWLITTADNVNAIRFYENRRMSRRTLHRNVVDHFPTYKPDSVRKLRGIDIESPSSSRTERVRQNAD
jgi:hypothetical protein